MSLRRLVVISLSVDGALVLTIVLCLTLADLGRHKGPKSLSLHRTVAI
jgi:hypothetical protein